MEEFVKLHDILYNFHASENFLGHQNIYILFVIITLCFYYDASYGFINVMIPKYIPLIQNIPWVVFGIFQYL